MVPLGTISIYGHKTATGVCLRIMGQYCTLEDGATWTPLRYERKRGSGGIKNFVPPSASVARVDDVEMRASKTFTQTGHSQRVQSPVAGLK